jgi:hypothetical protein
MSRPCRVFLRYANCSLDLRHVSAIRLDILKQVAVTVERHRNGGVAHNGLQSLRLLFSDKKMLQRAQRAFGQHDSLATLTAIRRALPHSPRLAAGQWSGQRWPRSAAPHRGVVILFNDLVGSDEHRGRDFEAKCLRSLLVDP